MAYMKIHCGNCGGSWEIYSRDDWKDPKARQCPHCFCHVSKQVWSKEVLEAFGAGQDALRELYKDATGYHNPMFTIDFMSGQKPPRAANCPLMGTMFPDGEAN